MASLPDPKLQPEESNVIYVAPPWAVRAQPAAQPRRAPNALLNLFLFEAKLLAVTVLLLTVAYFGIVGFYRAKCAMGLDLLPGIHFPDVFPMPM